VVALLSNSCQALAAEGALGFGDDACTDFAQRLRKDFPAAVHAEGNCAATLPASLPKVVLLVVNAFAGIRPENRTQIAELKARGITDFAIVLANTDRIDDPELLELEVLELGESMNAMGLPGDDIAFVLDHESAPFDPDIPIRKGLREVANVVDILGGPE
jgi:hypothetical protein